MLLLVVPAPIKMVPEAYALAKALPYAPRLELLLFARMFPESVIEEDAERLPATCNPAPMEDEALEMKPP